jgi:AcrR family transcriptional regulator
MQNKNITTHRGTSTALNSSSNIPAKIKRLRKDGVDARNRLLDAALHLFARNGFAKTSTREIAQAARVNLSSISYYFGDKEGLYRAVIEDPRNNPNLDPEKINPATMDLRGTLHFLFERFVAPLLAGEAATQAAKLHFREIAENTGVCTAEIDQRIKPGHIALVKALCRHLNIEEADDDVYRLSFCITGLGIMLHVGVDAMQLIRPQIISTPIALDDYLTRLVDYGVAMVESEKLRRLITTAEVNG